MALKPIYTNTFFSENDSEYTVNICIDGSGTPTPQNINISSCNIVYEGDGEGLFDVILQGSSCTVGIDVDRVAEPTLDLFLSQLIGNENYLFIEIIRNGSRHWIGKCMLDVSEVEDAPFYTYNLTAVCGLGQLKDYDFDFITTSKDEYLVLGEVIRQALGPCYTGFAYGSSSPYITSFINIYEEDMAADNVNCPLELTRVTRSFFIEDIEQNIPVTCSQAIEKILRPFGSRIRMQNGHWHIIKADSLHDANPFRFTYGNRDYSDGPLTISNNSVLVSEGSSATTLAGNNFTFKPALVRVDTLFKQESNYGWWHPYGTGVETQNLNVVELNTYPIEIQANITYDVPRIVFNNTNQQAPGVVRWDFLIKAREGDTTKYVLTYDSVLGFYWTTDLNASAWYDFNAVTDTRLQDTQELRIVIPTLDDTTIDNIRIEHQVSNIGGPCNGGIEWGGTFAAKQQFANGEFEDENVYTALNDTLNNNSVYKKYETELGDSMNSFCLGALNIYDGSDWIRSKQWKNRVSSVYSNISQLHSNTLLNFQSDAVYTYQGSYTHTVGYSPVKLLEYDGRKYFFNAGTWNLKEDVVQGDWVAIWLGSSTQSEDTTQPRDNATQALEKRVKALSRLLQDNTTGIGKIHSDLKKSLQEIERLKNIVAQKQDNIWDILSAGETVDGTTTYTIKIQNGVIKTG